MRDFECAIRMQSPARKRMTREGFVVRWTEKMCVGANELEQRDRLIGAIVRHHCVRGSIPARIWLLDDVSHIESVLVRHDDWQWCARGTRRQVFELDDAVLFIDFV